METVDHRFISTPMGEFGVFEYADGSFQTAWFDKFPSQYRNAQSTNSSQLDELEALLIRYFDGEHVSFSHIALPPAGDFSRRCWRACQAIPYGQTASYGLLAEMAGASISSARAAGQAMRRNPVSIIVPCHRVVSAGGQLHGFSGCTDPQAQPIKRKAWLLHLEGAAVSMVN